ncbi:hypothetical protein ACIOKD_40660 [Streptomyces sp. NPDC087844]|uniref:hypothetical protein n=1 Tax=Streptomyces sp. NPDC087844 TaxID=3365805 RepID=UPI00381E18C1
MTYCVVIGACQDLQELRGIAGVYRGLCRVHRPPLPQLGGTWPDAVHEASLACTRLTAGQGGAGGAS